MVEKAPEALSADQARWACTGDSFREEADPVPEELQTRAISALRFGVEAGPDFHLVAVGSSRVGMERYITWLLDEIIDSLPPCCDWCYVNNFDDPYAPIAIRLPTGRGRGFHDAMGEAIEDLRGDIQRAFSAESYQERRQSLIEHVARERDEAFARLEERARELGFTLIQSREGLVIVPVVDGEPINQQDFAKLPAEQREEMEKARTELAGDLERTMRRIREIDDEIRRELRDFDREVALEVIQHRLAPLREEYEEFEKILQYL
ncbi:MAG: Lon-like protease helical domain-containing protein, partial [Chloroflexota bacterium]